MISFTHALNALKLLHKGQQPRDDVRSSEELAVHMASRYARVRREEMKCIKCFFSGELYEISFRTDWMEYDCFVDAFCGEVCGFNAEPLRY